METGEIRGSLRPRYELAQYNSGLTIELGEKALKLLDVLTAPDVDKLDLHDRGLALRGYVIFKNINASEEVA
jgi:hypothetical protein